MAGTDHRQENLTQVAPVIILVNPQLGENIGTAARAMANFGLHELRIVEPRDGWPNAQAHAAASRADHVIDGVQVFDDLAQSIEDLSLVFATTARDRTLFKPVIGPKEAVSKMHGIVAQGKKVGILFGRERWGLKNHEISLADEIVTLPVNPAFASLNIAQAVLILAYEWRIFQDQGEILPFQGFEEEPAQKQELFQLFEHLETVLDKAGYFRAPNMRHVMKQNLRSLLTRPKFSSEEIRVLRGVIAAFDRAFRRKG